MLWLVNSSTVLTIVAVRVDDSTAIQGGNSMVIQGPIQQLESTLESPEILNCRIASRGDSSSTF